MVQLDQDGSTQCAVYDKSPESEQKKINIVVRPAYTVAKVIADITTQYRYETFDLVLQPTNKEKPLVYLNERREGLIYDVPGFEPSIKNTLILLPAGEWDGNVKRHYDLAMPPLKCAIYNGSSNHSSQSYTHATTSSSNTHTTMITNGINITTNTTTKTTTVEAGGAASSEGATSRPSTSTTITTITTHTTNTTSTTADDSSSLNLSPISDPDQLSDDDLALGASASPTEIEPPMSASGLSLGSGVGILASTSSASHMANCGVSSILAEDDLYKMYSPKKTLERGESTSSSVNMKYPLSTMPSTSSTLSGGGNCYVGLVNQAMTCYLNSLLQALYMTPEFRNALYRWEFDNEDEAKNIPYQLQKLFLNLQTSRKSSIETTDLTRSFGWDSTEAWQQHDIQELCRVMFDALEHKFRNTKQANLISNLYEGKMIDYVKCLECQTEKTRADTFLDIPLPVRPFGSTVSYGSIEEALRAFVQPETLDGNNQYHCEKCNKKCDAHKGLKFKNFPYILTLHLKRFDFDYSTMHRIKLNDKVTFPQSLNLNSFMNDTAVPTFANGNGTTAASAAATTSNGYVLNGAHPNGANGTDDCSTTDSGSAMEEDACSSGIATTASSSQHENDMNYEDADEGIDMSTSTNAAEQCAKHESGPYLYELFAIMIHSGSASGGHYYAYIKEFENNEWFCFNDQSVSPLTQEDIERSFGGVTTKAYYSSVYSASTNAYMLMYRLVDPKNNEHSMTPHDFPPHIQQLLPKLNSVAAADEARTGCRPSGRLGGAYTDMVLPELIKPRVYFYNPQLRKLKVTRVYVSRSFDVKTVLESAYTMLNVERFAPLARCRLVGYDIVAEEILQSFEYVDDPALTEVRDGQGGTLDFLLEYCAEGQEFEVYQPGGATWYVYMVNLSTMEMDGPFLVYSNSDSTATPEEVAVLRRSIAVRLHIKEADMLLATLPRKKAFVAYDPTPTSEAEQRFVAVVRSQFRDMTFFYLNVPNTDAASLEMLGIPAYEAATQTVVPTAAAPTAAPAIEVSADVVDAVLMNGGAVGASDSSNSLLGPTSATNSNNESNSEDSSLSDGDRTLVESLQNRCTSGGGGDSQISSSSSHSPQLSSPEDEPAEYNRTPAYSTDAAGDSSAYIVSTPSQAVFFHAIQIEGAPEISSSSTAAADDSDSADSRKLAVSYKILVNSHMKLDVFKRHVAALIRVPANYFKIQHKYESSEPINTAHSLVFLSEGETLQVELGKQLAPDEHKAKVSFLRLSELDNDSSKLPRVCEWIYTSSMTMREAKLELITKLQRIDAAKYKTLTLENCRLWLKIGRNTVKIIADDETISNNVGVLTSSVKTEFIVQECEDGIKPQSSDDSLTIFVRRWHADKLQLDKFQEITLEKDSEIQTKLAEITDIKPEHIAYSKINTSFPSTNLSLLSINTTLSWFSIPATLDKYPLTTTINGNVYFYKDVTKAPKELSQEERRELMAKEKTRLDRLGCISTSLYSPRRERALKIYLDTPQAMTSASTPMDAKED